ncbi:hypothetical protein P3G55_24330 [Leptospira sp. 96542]|nr:hypothetical protein [Leptospira sp. 96542]
MPQLEFAIVQLLQACENLQQGGFSCPVPTDESDALARFQREIGAIQQGCMTKGQRSIHQRDI